MKNKDKEKAPVEDGLAAQVRKNASDIKGIIGFLEELFELDINKDGKIGWKEGGVRLWLLVLVAVAVTMLAAAAFAAEDVIANWIAQEGNDAVLQLEADEGDDAADELELIMKADGTAALSVGGTEVQEWQSGEGGASVTAAGSTVTATTYDGPINKTTLVLDDLEIIIDGSSGAGWGTSPVATTMQAYVHIVGVKVDDLSMTGDGGDVEDGEGGDFSVGTTATDDNSLATTEINLLASTSLDPIQTAVDAVQVVDIVPIDGTAAGVPIHLNMLMDDGDVAGASTNTVDATITLYWLDMGDN